MKKERLYMEIENYRGYDSFMIPVNKKDQTWKSILGDIETVLDAKFSDNGDEIDGISLKLRFVMENPSNIEIEDW